MVTVIWLLVRLLLKLPGISRNTAEQNKAASKVGKPEAVIKYVV